MCANCAIANWLTTIRCSPCPARDSSRATVIQVRLEYFHFALININNRFFTPGGHIHETNTVSHVIPNSVQLHGRPSLEFSWFPGYTWQIATCGQCNQHLGWKFVAGEASNLKPKKFYGLAGRGIALWKYSSVEEEID